MLKNPTSSLTVFDDGTRLDYLEQDGEILLTAEEIGRHLGYGDPAHAIHRIYRKNKNELKHYSTKTKMVSVDGKLRETRAFTEEGVYILTMLARTNQAKKFRAQVALLLRRKRREETERLTALAREAGFEAARELLGPETITATWKAGRKDGIEAVFSLTPFQQEIARDVRRYRDMGLTQKEIARLIGCCKDTVGATLRKLQEVA